MKLLSKVKTILHNFSDNMIAAQELVRDASILEAAEQAAIAKKLEYTSTLNELTTEELEFVANHLKQYDKKGEQNG
jgi:hypothetical protein